MGSTEFDRKKLAYAAIQARQNAYAPYSHFKVGAALLCKDKTVITGCNIENASYPATNCAERTAIFKAVSEGHKDFVAIAIAGGKEDIPETYAYPCGICRQVMAEFCDKEFVILVVKSIDSVKEFTLGELLPESFEL